MHIWTSTKIKRLRLQLGWSAANFSRYLQTTLAEVVEWESGITAPTADEILKLELLEFHLDSYCEQVQRGPHAERALSAMRLDQIGADDLQKFIREL